MNNIIFLTFDDGYSKYADICLNSLEANYPDHPPVKIMYTGNDPSFRNSLSARPKVEVLDHELDMTQFNELNLGHIGSPMIYARFVLWSNMFDEYDNILYLDCDTIVMKPFPEVFERTDFFAVSDNSWELVFLDDAPEKPEFQAALAKDNLELEKINTYMINSGFFLLPKKYRTPENYAQIWRLTDTYNEYINHSDQSVISLWMYLNDIPMSDQYQYNFQTQFLFRDTLNKLGQENIKIMHYSGWKPDRNFDELLVPANYVFHVLDTFNKFKNVTEPEVLEKA